MRSYLKSWSHHALPTAALLAPVLALLLALGAPGSGAQAASFAPRPSTLSALTPVPQPSTDPALTISPDKQFYSVVGGRTYRYDLKLTNWSATDTFVALGASASSGWTVAVAQQQALVPAKSSIMVSVKVAVPALQPSSADTVIQVTAKTQRESANAYIVLRLTAPATD
jgi:hypothetical protein